MANGSLTPSTITTFVELFVCVVKKHLAALDLDCTKRRDDRTNVDIVQFQLDFDERIFLWCGLLKDKRENVRVFWVFVF
jgi:hypothetical protein